jgi:hypothetical protein
MKMNEVMEEGIKEWMKEGRREAGSGSSEIKTLE